MLYLCNTKGILPLQRDKVNDKYLNLSCFFKEKELSYDR